MGLDHVVIAVHDLQQAMADYAALGFQVLAGGAHPGRESHNALVVFDDGAYLELIAWRAANDEPWYRTLQADGEGLVDHALLPEDLVAVADAARQRGLATLGPVIPGGRLRPDGERVAWQSARQATRALPFLCADLTPRALRVPEGAARRQPNGLRGVAAVVVAVPELQPAQMGLQALLGETLQPGLPAEVATAWPALDGPGLASAWAALRGCSLVLVAPCPASGPADSSADASELATRLARRGPGPWRLLMRGPEHGSTQAEGPRPMDPALCHGVSMAVASG